MSIFSAKSANHCRHDKTIMTGNARRESGVGLIEVLLAVVVLSIGFLAAARMQVQGMRYSQNAYALSQAKFMALEMSERMRANRDGMLDGNYNSISTATAVTKPACVSNATVCTAAQIATADAFAWRQNLVEPTGSVGFIPLLPSSATIPALGTVQFDASEQLWNVTVQWSEQLDSGPNQRTIVVQVKR